MPKMQVYLPDDLYARLKATGAGLNVSGILQAALTEELARRERREALASWVASSEREHGAFTDEELASQIETDRAAARRPRPKKKRPSAA